MSNVNKTKLWICVTVSDHNVHGTPKRKKLVNRANELNELGFMFFNSISKQCSHACEYCMYLTTLWVIVLMSIHTSKTSLSLVISLSVLDLCASTDSVYLLTTTQNFGTNKTYSLFDSSAEASFRSYSSTKRGL